MGCTDEEMTGWRAQATKDLGRELILNPTRRDYRATHEQVGPWTIVQNDLEDIAKSNIVLVNASRPSWGTAMEIVYAKILNKIVVAYCPTEKSPWLKYHSTIVKDTLEEAVEWINKFHDSILEEGLGN